LVTVDDLIRLRDFGGMGLDTYAGPPVAVSPSGEWIAVQLRRADPVSNRYCVGIVVKKIAGGQPHAVAEGGEMLRLSFDKYGIAGLVSGAPTPSILRWSPDGRWLGYTREAAGILQVWRIRPDGSGEEQLTHARVNVEDFQWTNDSKAIVYRSRPGLIDANAQIDAEGKSGYRYDARFWTLASNRPYPASTIPTAIDTVYLNSGIVRTSDDPERQLLEPQRARDWPSSAVKVARAKTSDGAAWLVPEQPGAILRPNFLHAAMGGREFSCPDDACRDVVDMWWSRNGRTLFFLQRRGPARSDTILFRWRPGQGSPRKILVTKDAWLGCQLPGRDLICAAEGSTSPRHVIAIDSETAAVRTVFDPNPEFEEIRLSPPQRLVWSNSFGIETFGDLVLPPDYRAGTRLPLIIVQYDSRGFLRGGTADEFPIQAFAAHGFAVLSFNRPPWYALSGPPLDLFAFLRANQKDWLDRRSVNSSLETIIHQLVEKEIVDPKRVGITGQSDGASTVTFALIHSRLYAAAAISTCCESSSMMTMLGPGFADWYARSGYPRVGEERPDFWESSSIDRNTKSLAPTPLLIQAGEEEYRLSLETFEAVKAAGWPVEMYVFPGESHVKIQPEHRLAVYNRNIAWFERWLKPKPIGR
jgi:dipeptidyl aminopeptidase/acylaminoacyl peptidase